jgi:ABC-type glycerol-3-phosphate transport system substrate-binding protein
VRKALALLAAMLVVAGCGSSGRGADTQPTPAYHGNSNQLGEQTP